MEFTKEENIINDDFLNSLIYELTVKPEDRQQQKFDFEPLLIAIIVKVTAIASKLVESM